MKEKIPQVSVLMSVYSEPLEWVKQAIDSILTQTFTDFEFIIINDKPDRAELSEFLKHEAEKDTRIKVHTNPENIGLTKSLNVGLKLCQGKYIARMDADDISHNERIEKQVSFMERNPLVGVCGTDRNFIDEKGMRSKKRNTRHLYSNELKSIFLLRSPFVHPSVMFRHRIIDEGYKYDETFVCAQDYNLWGRLLLDNEIFRNIEDRLLDYRISVSQLSSSRNSIQIHNAVRTRQLFAEHFGLILPYSDYLLLVQSFSGKYKASYMDVCNLILILSKIKNHFKQFQWFESRSFDIESCRLLLLFCAKCQDRIKVLIRLLKSPYCSAYLLYRNLNFFISRI